MKIKAIRGAKDVLPKEADIWRRIEKLGSDLCQTYGYRQIRTPLLEEARLFVRSIGKSSDIVRKEMYSFKDSKKRVLCLRPEATASVVRAYLEHNLDKESNLAKFYYFGPMFRAERPQAGRLRQFHHLGVEAIGSLSHYLDAEVISLAINILDKIGLKGFTLQLNSIGCPKDRQRYNLILKKALKSKRKLLCSDCQKRYNLNLLRIFDCKNAACQKTIRQLPLIVDFLCPLCLEHFRKVKQSLDDLDMPYALNPYLMRGLDYYTKTCFEITHPALGAQNAIGAGGRYDGLIKDLGGPQRPAVGFALGVERVINALEPKNRQSSGRILPSVYIAVIGDKPKKAAFKILHSLRKQGIPAEADYLDKSLKAQMRQADKLGAKYAAILGEDELQTQTVILRDMQEKIQKEVKIADLAEAVK